MTRQTTKHNIPNSIFFATLRYFETMLNILTEYNKHEMQQCRAMSSNECLHRTGTIRV